ncbi:hypothetical protein [Bacillus sp. PS06]|uniref:hypothetical protein n=1 Tax=Bacillus sp. PS06 TaxID=2764176 RepID=UPI0017805A0A|nr:hypothetical protein [Bacillus sp. PS06]MBD8067671.1 hypothetical protein [Bacillus sp. PS06]
MYYYQPGYYPPYIPPRYYPWMRQQLPVVDPNLLYQSANASKKLMNDASIVLNRLSVSKEFDSSLMAAAQASNKNEVKRLIQSTGVTSDVDVKYSPDGITLEFNSAEDPQDCCKLTIALRWR